MIAMFAVRPSPCPAPNMQSSPPLHAACAAVSRRLPPPGPHLAPHRMPSVRHSAVRVGVQPAAELRHLQRHEHERHVQCALLPAPCSQSAVEPSPLHAACTAVARRLPPPGPHLRPAPYALLATRQYATSLSNANKLLIRCAWAGTSAFASAGYGSIWSWGPGTCPATFTSTAALKTAVQANNANPTAAIATYGPIADWDVSAITDMGGLFKYLKNFDADVSNWDTSSVTTMYQMFWVRSTPVLPRICSRASTARWTPSPPSAGPHPRPAPYALRSTLG
eukprot:scaffold3508_cov47-Phaeocystis_antarctica.AAC.1